MAHWNPEAWIAAMDGRLDPFRRLLLDGFLTSLLADWAGGRAIDLGCGEGAASRSLAERGWSITGLDLDPHLLRVARRRGGGVHYVRGNAAELPFGGACCDLVLSKLTSVAISDYASFVREAARVLRPGGRLVDVITHPCFTTFTGSRSRPNDYLRRTRRKIAFHFPGGARIGAVRNFHRPLETYVAAITDAGLNLERMHEPPAPRELVSSTTWRRVPFRGPPFLILVGRKP